MDKEVVADDYYLFIGLAGLCFFELLALLRLNHSINWYWIFIIIPLEISIGFLSVIAFKKARSLLSKILTDKYSYYGVMGLFLLTVKTMGGIITWAALAEIYEPFYQELNLVYCTVIALLVIWIPVILCMFKELQRLDKRLPFVIIQNLVLINAFFVNFTI